MGHSEELAGFVPPALGPALYERDGADLAARGLYLDLPAWGCHAFELLPV